MPVKHFEMVGSPGIVRDVPEQTLIESAFTDGKNFRFNQNGCQNIPGDKIIFSEATITPLWTQAFPPITSPIWAYGDLTEMWAVEGTTHTEITRVSGDYSGIATERWNASVLSGLGFMNNTIDIPQAWTDIDTSTKLVDLANWDTARRCKSLRGFKNYLIALNMTDSSINRPYRVLWSSPAAPGSVPPSWDTGDPTQEAGEFDLAETPDYLVDSLPMSDINIIYKENTTWGMSYIGYPFIFRFWKILSHRGLLHRDCVANYPGGHCVATQDDIIIHSGQTEGAQSIIDKRLRQSLFSAIDPTNFRNCFMFAYNRRNEIWFCFPELGETYASMALIWDWTTNAIGLRELTPTPYASIGPIGDSLVSDLVWG